MRTCVRAFVCERKRGKKRGSVRMCVCVCARARIFLSVSQCVYVCLIKFFSQDQASFVYAFVLERNCSENEFTCETDSTVQCIPNYQVCDNILHCADGSDESPEYCGR